MPVSSHHQQHSNRPPWLSPNAIGAAASSSSSAAAVRPEAAFPLAQWMKAVAEAAAAAASNHNSPLDPLDPLSASALVASTTSAPSGDTSLVARRTLNILRTTWLAPPSDASRRGNGFDTATASGSTAFAWCVTACDALAQQTNKQFSRGGESPMASSTSSTANFETYGEYSGRSLPRHAAASTTTVEGAGCSTGVPPPSPWGSTSVARTLPRSAAVSVTVGTHYTHFPPARAHQAARESVPLSAATALLIATNHRYVLTADAAAAQALLLRDSFTLPIHQTLREPDGEDDGRVCVVALAVAVMFNIAGHCGSSEECAGMLRDELVYLAAIALENARRRQLKQERAALTRPMVVAHQQRRRLMPSAAPVATRFVAAPPKLEASAAVPSDAAEFEYRTHCARQLVRAPYSGGGSHGPFAGCSGHIMRSGSITSNHQHHHHHHNHQPHTSSTRRDHHGGVRSGGGRGSARGDSGPPPSSSQQQHHQVVRPRAARTVSPAAANEAPYGRHSASNSDAMAVEERHPFEASSPLVATIDGSPDLMSGSTSHAGPSWHTSAGRYGSTGAGAVGLLLSSESGWSPSTTPMMKPATVPPSDHRGGPSPPSAHLLPSTSSYPSGRGGGGPGTDIGPDSDRAFNSNNHHHHNNNSSRRGTLHQHHPQPALPVFGPSAVGGAASSSSVVKQDRPRTTLTAIQAHLIGSGRLGSLRQVAKPTAQRLLAARRSSLAFRGGGGHDGGNGAATATGDGGSDANTNMHNDAITGFADSPLLFNREGIPILRAFSPLQQQQQRTAGGATSSSDRRASVASKAGSRPSLVAASGSGGGGRAMSDTSGSNSRRGSVVVMSSTTAGGLSRTPSRTGVATAALARVPSSSPLFTPGRRAGSDDDGRRSVTDDPQSPTSGTHHHNNPPPTVRTPTPHHSGGGAGAAPPPLQLRRGSSSTAGSPTRGGSIAGSPKQGGKRSGNHNSSSTAFVLPATRVGSDRVLRSQMWTRIAIAVTAGLMLPGSSTGTTSLLLRRALRHAGADGEFHFDAITPAACLLMREHDSGRLSTHGEQETQAMSLLILFCGSMPSLSVPPRLRRRLSLPADRHWCVPAPLGTGAADLLLLPTPTAAALTPSGSVLAAAGAGGGPAAVAPTPAAMLQAAAAAFEEELRTRGQQHPPAGVPPLALQHPGTGGSSSPSRLGARSGWSDPGQAGSGSVSDPDTAPDTRPPTHRPQPRRRGEGNAASNPGGAAARYQMRSVDDESGGDDSSFEARAASGSRRPPHHQRKRGTPPRDGTEKDMSVVEVETAAADGNACCAGKCIVA